VVKESWEKAQSNSYKHFPFLNRWILLLHNYVLSEQVGTAVEKLPLYTLSQVVGYDIEKLVKTGGKALSDSHILYSDRVSVH